jgi:CheY-like chemotaxis protein/anti-sigma regulatory factor (Ser/Thr protein kinase)
VIIDRATEVVRPLIREKGHQLTASQPPIPLLLNADPSRLEQILVNLLTNAAKYTKPGGQIELSTRRDRDKLVITVHDSGVGISPEMLPRIFDLFTQVDVSLDRSQGGLGIGLTLVRRLVELHGGSVSVASEGEGKGSEFVVWLPAGLDEATLEAPLTNTARPDANPQRSRVLVVDDDLDIGRGMARLLKVSGHDVQTAHDGPSAIEIARTQHPDAILLDIGLPGMNGFEVVKVLRQDEGCKDTILIAVSGYGQEDDRRRSHEAGFHHHLVKPINFDELLTLLTRPSPAPPT